METKPTPTEMPTSSRPAAASANVGASANSTPPSAAMAVPLASNRRGPQRSASSPVGICAAT